MAVALLAACAALAWSGRATGETSPGPPSAPVEQLAGQRILFGFLGTEPPPDLLRRIGRGEVAGVILYRRNITSRGQLRALTAALQRRRPRGDPPLLVMLDQEGGLVSRLTGPPRHSAAELGRIGSASLAQSEGRATARSLRRVGVNVNLAPVADLGRAGGLAEQQGRTYSRHARRVARLASAFARGLRERGVAATAKHFPGLGYARVDQDGEMNTIRLSREHLRSNDLLPFARLAADGVEMMMLTTALYPALDSRPAALSPRIIGGELRDRMGFRGLTMTDSLSNRQARAMGSLKWRLLRATRAGEDLLMFADWYDAGAEAADELARLLRDGRLARPPFEAAVGRLRELRERLRATP